MKHFLRSMILSCLLLVTLPLEAAAAELLIPVGQVIGLQLQDESLTVAAFDDRLGAGAREAGVKIGDALLRIDGSPVESVTDVRSALDRCQGQVSLTLRRDGQLTQVHMTPSQTQEGPRLGICLRQGIAGIGTVTFFDPETGLFGTLGHGVNDAKGSLLSMSKGAAYPAQVQSVKKGKTGEPGQLKGLCQSQLPLGPLLRNTPQGVFGITEHPWTGEALPTAEYSQIQPGSAFIRSTVAGDSVQEYSVEILKIYPQDRPDGRNFLLKVTDPDLLTATGGIVQGMGVSYNRDNPEKPLACKGFWR